MVARFRLGTGRLREALSKPSGRNSFSIAAPARCCKAPGDGNIEQRIERADLVLRILGAYEIMIAVALVDPESGTEADAGVEAGDDVLHGFHCDQSQKSGFRPGDVQRQLRIVEPLREAHLR